MNECKHGKNKWSCQSCEIELLKYVIKEQEDAINKLNKTIEHAKYETELMINKFSSIKDILEGEYL